MTLTNKLRISTLDAADAIDIACSEVQSAVGLPVHAEFQEIEGSNLILELRLGVEAVDVPPPSRLALVVEKSSPNVEVLSAWRESEWATPSTRRCHNVLGERFDAMPAFAHRALADDLPTAQWNRSDVAWHLAVPSVCGDQRIVGLSHRCGYTRRFTTHEVTSLRTSLAS
jgi:hypothetical protein